MTPPDVLIVAAAKAVREMLREILEVASFRVTEARSETEAATAARSIPFDAIVVEVEGGEHDTGVWLFRRVQSWGDAPPVVALVNEPGMERELGRIGFAAVLVRPVDAATLVETIREVVERHRDDDLR